MNNMCKKMKVFYESLQNIFSQYDSLFWFWKSDSTAWGLLQRALTGLSSCTECHCTCSTLQDAIQQIYLQSHEF